MSRLIGELDRADIIKRLRGDGIVIDSGAVSTRIFSRAPEVADTIMAAYGPYPLIEGEHVSDYRVKISQSGGIRRVFRRQVLGEVGVSVPITPFPVAITPLMLEMTMNWCVATRANRYLIFHAAVLEKNGKAVIFPGDSGQGKSTLCAAMATSGWRLFSDEFGLMDLDTGMMVPNVRPVSLKNESIDVMEARLGSGILTDRLYDTPKGTIAYLPAPADAVARRMEPAAPAAVIFPFYHAEMEDAVAPYSKARGLISLCGGAANFEMLGSRAFDVMTRFTDLYPVARIAYSRLDNAMALIDRIVEEGVPVLEEMRA